MAHASAARTGCATSLTRGTAALGCGFCGLIDDLTRFHARGGRTTVMKPVPVLSDGRCASCETSGCLSPTCHERLQPRRTIRALPAACRTCRAAEDTLVRAGGLTPPPPSRHDRRRARNAGAAGHRHHHDVVPRDGRSASRSQRTSAAMSASQGPSARSGFHSMAPPPSIGRVRRCRLDRESTAKGGGATGQASYYIGPCGLT